MCGIMRKARAAALEESTEHLIRTIGLGEILRIVTNKDELFSSYQKVRKCLMIFSERSNTKFLAQI